MRQHPKVPMDRSAVMARVKSKNTKPEMIVRRAVFALGYRYRLHARDLPGTPDLVFRARRKVILVNGCFWHGHNCKLGDRRPKTRIAFWNAKIDQNIARDVRTSLALAQAGFTSLVVWECEIAEMEAVSRRISAFLGDSVRTRQFKPALCASASANQITTAPTPRRQDEMS